MEEQWYDPARRPPLVPARSNNAKIKDKVGHGQDE
jgi:hypothetical protein